MTNGDADDPVERVREYCAVLADLGARMDAASGSLEELGQRLSDDEGVTRHTWDQLSEALRALIQAAGDGDAPGHALAALATEAKGLGDRLGSVGEELDAAGEELTVHMQRAHGTLTQAALMTESRGYDTARARLEQCAQEIEAALNALESDAACVVNGLLSAEAQLDAASAALAGSASEVAVGAHETHGNIQSLTESTRAQGDAADAAAQREEEALTALYGELGDRLTHAADRLAQTLGSLGVDTSETLEAVIRTLAEAESEAIEPAQRWATELAALARVLEAGEDEASDLRPRLADLGISKRKVAELQDVIEAMDT